MTIISAMVKSNHETINQMIPKITRFTVIYLFQLNLHVPSLQFYSTTIYTDLSHSDLSPSVL